MFKNKNESHKISNGFFLVMGFFAFLSMVSILLNGEYAIEGTSSDYYFNIFMLLIYSVTAGLILLFTNKKNILYKDDFCVSRRLFNLFVMISVMSMVITIGSNVLSYFFYDNFSWYSMIVVIIGYIPCYIVAYKEVSKGILLSKNNISKINVSNFLVIYLLMQYYINVIAIISQMIFKMAEMAILIKSLCFAFVWIFVVIIAYRLINNKKVLNFKIKKHK